MVFSWSPKNEYKRWGNDKAMMMIMLMLLVLLMMMMMMTLMMTHNPSAKV